MGRSGQDEGLERGLAQVREKGFESGRGEREGFVCHLHADERQ